MSSASPEIRRDPTVFEELGAWWNSCPGPQSTPFLRSEWFDIWSRSFLPPGSELEVMVWERNGELTAILPLFRKGLRHFSLANAHSDVFDLIASPNAESSPKVRPVLEGFPVTRLYRLDGQSSLVPAAPGPSWLVDQVAEAPFLELDHDVEAMMSGLGRTLRGDLRRRERRLAEEGEVVYLDNADGELPDAFENCLELEMSGWKGEAGTAMLSRPESSRFYHDLAELARDQGWLRLSILLIAERLVAFQLNLDYGGRRFLLKTGFDEELGRLSPGKVLQWRVLQGAAQRGLVSYEFGGEAEDWKLGWTSTVRPRINVLLFGSRGTARWLGGALRGVATRRSGTKEDSGAPHPPSSDE